MNHLAGMDYLGIGIAVIMSFCAVYSIVELCPSQEGPSRTAPACPA